MSYRHKQRQASKHNVRVGEYLPLWSQQSTDTSLLMFRLLAASFGVTDVSSYILRLWGAILLCVLLGAVIGAWREGWSGLLWYGLAGLVTPAALLWLAAVLSYLALRIAVFFIVWLLLIEGVLWLLGQ